MATPALLFGGARATMELMHSGVKILVVEDEAAIQKVAQAYLHSAGYEVRCVASGVEALGLAQTYQPALVVLDLNLPGMDGLEVATRLRQVSDVYILILTARGEEGDRVAGLRLGADDYLTKPFSPRELVARVEAILRRQRGRPTLDQRLHFTCVSLDEETHEVWTSDGTRRPDTPLSLTTTEFNLLRELMRHPKRVMTREQLIDRVWGGNFYGNDRVVDVYVGQVRRKLEQATGQRLLQTVRGVGYKFVDEKA